MSSLTFLRTKAGKLRSLLLHTDSEREYARAISIIGARLQKQHGNITFSLDYTMISSIKERLPEVHIHDDVRTWEENERALVVALATPHPVHSAIALHPQAHLLRLYQQQGVQWLVDQQRTILGDVPGLGKTVQSLIATDILHAERLLIVCPALVKWQWQQETLRWIGREALVVDGHSRERKQQLAEQHPVTIITYEVLRDAIAKTQRNNVGKQERIPPLFPEILRYTWDVAIIDEAHRLQNQHSQQSKAAAILSRKVPSVFLLTGNPIWNMPQSVWHLLHLINPLRFSSEWTFVQKYCDMKHTIYGAKIVGIKEEKEQEFQELLAAYCLQRTKEGVLPDLPPKLHVSVPYLLSAEERKIYTTIERSLLIPRADDPQFLSSAAAAIEPLRRLCNAAALLGITVASTKDSTLLAQVQAILERGKRTVILCWHRDYAAHMQQLLLAHHISSLNAAIDNPRMRIAGIESFIHSQQSVLIGTIAGMGIGINLDMITDEVIFAEHDWTPALNAQAEDRFHRFTTTRPVTIYHLVGTHTIEDTIVQVASMKEQVTNRLFHLQRVMEQVRQNIAAYNA